MTRIFWVECLKTCVRDTHIHSSGGHILVEEIIRDI